MSDRRYGARAIATAVVWLAMVMAAPATARASCRASGVPPDAPMALVLSGGGAKGAYEAGVAAALVERGLPIRLVAGSSAGALNAAMIASEPMMPQLLRSRLQGALVRALTAREIEDHQLRPNASFFLIKSQAVVTTDKGPQAAFAAEQTLLIQGEANADTPAEIILYRNKQARPSALEK